MTVRAQRSRGCSRPGRLWQRAPDCFKLGIAFSRKVGPPLAWPLRGVLTRAATRAATRCSLCVCTRSSTARTSSWPHRWVCAWSRGRPLTRSGSMPFSHPSRVRAGCARTPPHPRTPAPPPCAVRAHSRRAAPRSAGGGPSRRHRDAELGRAARRALAVQPHPHPGAQPPHVVIGRRADPLRCRRATRTFLACVSGTCRATPP